MVCAWHSYAVQSDFSSLSMDWTAQLYRAFLFYLYICNSQQKQMKFCILIFYLFKVDLFQELNCYLAQRSLARRSQFTAQNQTSGRMSHQNTKNSIYQEKKLHITILQYTDVCNKMNTIQWPFSYTPSTNFLNF